MPSISNKHLLTIGIGAGVITLATIGVILLVRKRSFDFSVFDSPDLPGSGHCIDPDLLKKLKALKKKTGINIFESINSGARSSHWNRMVGGVATSAHLMPKCMAVDIGVKNKGERAILVQSAKDLGFTRIGIGRSFVHLDIDPTKKQYVAWGYPAGSPPPLNPFV